MNIDHHIQLSLLEKLAASEEPVKYSDLKEGDIDNSLFSYHLNKLVARGMVEKIADGYGMTVEGARWINDNGLTIRPKETLRVFVAVVIKNENNEYLVRQRAGQLKAIINDYMLPAIPYTNNNDLPDQIDQVIKKYIPDDALIERQDYGFAQIKAVYVDAAKRALFHVTRCETKLFDPIDDQASEWYVWDQLTAIDHPSAEILRQIIQYTDDHGGHTSPVIVG